jgi:hypothetical protein
VVQDRSAQFILSFAAGIIILIGGIVSLLWLIIDFPPSFDPLADLRNVIGEQEFRSFQIQYTVAGLSSGVAVILTSLMLKMKPQESKRWGIMIIVLSVMSILGMGGFIFGMALGIIGGSIAIIRSKSLAIVEESAKPDTIKIAVEVKPPEKLNMVYKCSSCNIEFRSDEELKQHVIRMHLER